MNRNILLLTIVLAIVNRSTLFGVESLIYKSLTVRENQQDTMNKEQILYNGKVWRNQYYMIKGDEFLFSKTYSQGTVTINGNLYKNLLINYDIYNDEILTPKKDRSVIQLNKEMVDSFTMVSEGKTYRFVNAEADSLQGIKGYVKVLYNGKSPLYVKYKKEIASLAVDDKYDLFFPTYRIYLIKNGEVHQISGKNDLLKVFEEDKTQLKNFIRKNKLKVTKTEPESFIPVISYYDNISR